MAKAEKNEYDAPATFHHGIWHLYQPKERAYVKHDENDPSKVHVSVAGSGSVRVIDEAEFLETWMPSADVRTFTNVA